MLSEDTTAMQKLHAMANDSGGLALTEEAREYAYGAVMAIEGRAQEPEPQPEDDDSNGHVMVSCAFSFACFALRCECFTISAVWMCTNMTTPVSVLRLRSMGFPVSRSRLALLRITIPIVLATKCCAFAIPQDYHPTSCGLSTAVWLSGMV
eukprot:COSAG02_NODE_666_length_18722_cov_237.372765_8_plen_151_part_00